LATEGKYRIPNGIVVLWVMANIYWIISDIWLLKELDRMVTLNFCLAAAATVFLVIKMIVNSESQIFIKTFRRFKIKVR